VGEGWHLALGALFMVVVIFLPGGIMEGFWRIVAWVKKDRSQSDGDTKAKVKIRSSEG